MDLVTPSEWPYLFSSGGTAEKEGVNKDYAKLVRKVLVFPKDETSISFEIETFIDDAEEDSEEIFYVTLFKTWSDVVEGKYDAWTSGHIKDGVLKQKSYTYTVASSSTIENPANEGRQYPLRSTETKVQVLPLSTFKHFLAQLRHQT